MPKKQGGLCEQRMGQDIKNMPPGDRNNYRQAYYDEIKRGASKAEAAEYAESRVKNMHPLFKRMHNLDTTKKERFASSRHHESFGGENSGRYPKGSGSKDLKPGDRVRVHKPGDSFHGHKGTVATSYTGGTHMVRLETPKGDWHREYHKTHLVSL